MTNLFHVHPSTNKFSNAAAGRFVIYVIGFLSLTALSIGVRSFPAPACLIHVIIMTPETQGQRKILPHLIDRRGVLFLDDVSSQHSHSISSVHPMSTGCQKPKPPSSCEPNRCSNHHGSLARCITTVPHVHHHKVVEKMPLILLAYPMMYSTPDHPITRPIEDRAASAVSAQHGQVWKKKTRVPLQQQQAPSSHF